MGSVVKLMNCMASSSIFTEFQEVSKDLDTELALLVVLCCTSGKCGSKEKAFDKLVRQRALVDPPAIGEKKAEDLVDKILIKLEVKDFIEPVKKGTSCLRQFRMQHLVHRVVIMLAQEAQLLDYDSNGNRTVKSSW